MRPLAGQGLVEASFGLPGALAGWVPLGDLGAVLPRHALGVLPSTLRRHLAVVDVVASQARELPAEQVHVHDAAATPLEDTEDIFVIEDVGRVELQLQRAIPGHHP